MDAKGQVSFEYLMMVAFAVIMVMAAAVIAFNLALVAEKAQADMVLERDSTIGSLVAT